MRRVKEHETHEQLPPRRPSMTKQGRQAQLIALAIDLVEQRLRDGTATSQEVVHFLKLGSVRQGLQRQRLKNQNILLRAKTEALEAQARTEELYAAAIAAMKRYSGMEPEQDDEYEG